MTAAELGPGGLDSADARAPDDGAACMWERGGGNGTGYRGLEVVGARMASGCRPTESAQDPLLDSSVSFRA